MFKVTADLLRRLGQGLLVTTVWWGLFVAARPVLPGLPPPELQDETVAGPPIDSDVAPDTALPPPAVDTATADSLPSDTAVFSDTGLQPVDTSLPACADTAAVQCADEAPARIDVRRYPRDKDYAELPRDVAEIISQRCATCHRHGSNRGNIQIYDPANRQFPGNRKDDPAITLDQIRSRINSDNNNRKMPPPVRIDGRPAGTALTEEQLRKLNEWLDAQRRP